MYNKAINYATVKDTEKTIPLKVRLKKHVSYLDNVKDQNGIPHILKKW